MERPGSGLAADRCCRCAALQAEPLHPYGRDPAFMLSSELYNWRLKVRRPRPALGGSHECLPSTLPAADCASCGCGQGLEGRYYNLSAGVLGERAGDRDPEVNLFGNPYGWFSARLPGTPDGFPLVSPRSRQTRPFPGS